VGEAGGVLGSIQTCECGLVVVVGVGVVVVVCIGGDGLLLALLSVVGVNVVRS